MTGFQRALLTGAMALATCAAAAPAGATIVLTSTPGTLFGFSAGTFDLTSYLSDAQGRTFVIGGATLSATLHSDPHYGAPVTTTVDTQTGTEIISFSPVAIRSN